MGLVDGWDLRSGSDRHAPTLFSAFVDIMVISPNAGNRPQNYRQICSAA